MDFSQVNRVIVNGKEVREIDDSSHGTIWQKSADGWHTVWEGKKKIGSSYGNIGGQESKFVFGTVPYSDRVRLKVYFLSDMEYFSTYLITSNTDNVRMVKDEYIPANPNGDPSTRPNQNQSPVSYDNSAFVSTETTLAKASRKAVVGSTATDYNMSCEAVLQYNKDTGEIYGEYHKSHDNTGGRNMKIAAVITITKIEVYY